VHTLRVLVAIAVLVPGAVGRAQGFAIPAPRGFVNDFAGVIDSAPADTILRIIEFVRARSAGEITVVTLRDIGGRDANDVALRIGREWGVGLAAAVGDSARNTGVVILVVPKESSSDNRGYVAIQVGQGAEGFIPDGAAGAIWREALPLLQQADYGGALALMTYRVAARFATEFQFSLDSAQVAPPMRAPLRRTSTRSPAGGIVFVIFVVLVLAVMGSRGRGGMRRGRGRDLTWILLADAARRHGSRRSSGWGSGGFGGFGGGGGGFGGFGGGGGFSGGGASGRF
jgi:uncharacterized protein